MEYFAVQLKGFGKCCLLSVNQSLRSDNHVVRYFSAIDIYFAVKFVIHHHRYVDLLLSRRVV